MTKESRGDNSSQSATSAELEGLVVAPWGGQLEEPK